MISHLFFNFFASSSNCPIGSAPGDNRYKTGMQFMLSLNISLTVTCTGYMNSGPMISLMKLIEAISVLSFFIALIKHNLMKEPNSFSILDL